MQSVSFGFVVIALGCIALCVDGATVSPGQCVYQNKVYKVGERRSTDPCSWCTCEAGGSFVCLAVDCAPPNCVNPVNNAEQCCQHCPDGDNCMHNNVIIKAGDTYQPDPHITCQCSTDINHIFGPHRHEAVCTTSIHSNV